MQKEYYVIQNNEGKFFEIDRYSGGYPYFTDDFEFCERYHSKQLAEEFLSSRYVTEMFPHVFKDSSIKLVRMVVCKP